MGLPGSGSFVGVRMWKVGGLGLEMVGVRDATAYVT